LFVSFGKVKVKIIPLIIPRMYMSRASLREGAFERAGDFCWGCWFGIGAAGVGFDVGVLVSSGIFLLLRRGAGVVKYFLLDWIYRLCLKDLLSVLRFWFLVYFLF
jgi:hypothetical protein